MSIQGWIMNQMFRAVPGDPPGQPHDYAAERARNERRKPPRMPKDIVLEEITVNGMPAERLSKTGNNRGWIFYIHGGGFTTGSAKERRYVTQYLTGKCGFNCFAVNYRLSPENEWPAQAVDCLAAYRQYLEMGYRADETVFMGESAGGTLVFSTAFLARENGLPLPKALVAFSPATDNASDLPSHTANISTDYMLRDMVAKGLAVPLFKGVADRERLKDPLLSPIFGDFTGLPPVFLSASDTEVLYDDSVLLYEKLKKSGHAAELDIQHAQCHAFQMIPMIPEARKTIGKALRFIERSGR